MNATEPQTAFIGTFADRAGAERFVEALRAAGFRHDQIGVATPEEVASDEEATSDQVADSALTGALTGGTVGVFAGLALAAGLIPGVVVGGLLVGALGGGALGATAGELLGSMAGLEGAEEQGHDFHEHLRAGRTLVAVQAPGRIAETLAILRQCEAAEAPASTPGQTGGLGVEKLDELL